MPQIASERSTALYLYAIVPTLSPSVNLIGLEGISVYPLHCNGLSLLVHDSPSFSLAGEIEKMKKLALSHHRIVERAWSEAGTVIPVRFGTLIRDSEEKSARENLLQWVSEQHLLLQRRLEFLKDKAEYRLKISYDDECLRLALSKDGEMELLAQKAASQSRGLSFFYKKKLESALTEQVRHSLSNLRQKILETVVTLAEEVHSLSPGKEESLLLNLALLLRKNRLGELEEELEKIHAREGFSVVLTGPWPPYNFTLSEEAASP